MGQLIQTLTRVCAEGKNALRGVIGSFDIVCTDSRLGKKVLSTINLLELMSGL